MAQPESGFVVSTKTLTTVVSVFTILGLLFAGISKVNSYDFRISTLEADKIQNTASIDNLTKEIKELNSKIVDLTLALNTVQIRQGLNKPE